jgi:hypothetical protein
MRRITGSRPKLENQELTDRLHQQNLQRIAILRSQGWRDWQFLTSDQFGSHIFPHSATAFDYKGATHDYIF